MWEYEFFKFFLFGLIVGMVGVGILGFYLFGVLDMV